MKSGLAREESCNEAVSSFLNIDLYLISTEACVVSHAIFNVHPAAPLSNEIENFSCGAGSDEAVISTRPKSLAAPGYGTPHSPVFVLSTSVHLSLSGIVNNV
jgi:hypothetical protein